MLPADDKFPWSGIYLLNGIVAIGAIAVMYVKYRFGIGNGTEFSILRGLGALGITAFMILSIVRVAPWWRKKENEKGELIFPQLTPRDSYWRWFFPHALSVALLIGILEGLNLLL